MELVNMRQAEMRSPVGCGWVNQDGWSLADSMYQAYFYCRMLSAADEVRMQVRMPWPMQMLSV